MVKFQGLGTAIVTPFADDGLVDWNALEHLVLMQVQGGANFIVPCGTTGESPTLTYDEHIRIIQFVIKIVNGRIPVLAGTGSNSTAEAVELTKAAKELGADGALVVSPYYNKPTPAGLLDYYRQVAKVGLPVILYDIPGRTARGVPTDVILQLAKEGSIAGIKWASGDFSQLMTIVSECPEGFDILSGDDQLAFSLMTLGGHGVISVVGNIIPEKMADFVKMMTLANWETAREEHYRLLGLMRAMFFETNPQPVKTALAKMFPKIFKENFRSPMCAMANSNRMNIVAVLSFYDLVE